MELNIFINKLFQEAKNNGFNEYEVYYVDRESLSINAYNEEVEKYNLTTSYGLSFRGKINDKIGYSYTEILDDDAINMLVKNAKESALVIENEDIQFIYEGDKEYAEVNTYYKALENLPADKLIDLALSMEKEAKTLDNRVTSFGGCGIGYSKARYGIINSKGLNLENKSNLLSAYVVPIIKNGEDMHDGMGYVTANSIEDVEPKKLAQDGINEAISRIGGKSISSGKYKAVINNVIKSGFPYEPSWGKGTRGFKASNLWIGNEYFEMINLLKEDGGGWKKDWVDLYNEGHRGLICIMLDVDNINEVYENFKSKNISITNPEYLKFKWLFNLLTRTMPWQNSYIKFFEGIPLQIGFQQMKDDEARNFMKQYMVPNSYENGINGIDKVIVKGALTSNDKDLLKIIFDSYIIKDTPLTISLNEKQVLIFQEDKNYLVEIFCKCTNNDFVNKCIGIENITLLNL